MMQMKDDTQGRRGMQEWQMRGQQYTHEDDDDRHMVDDERQVVSARGRRTVARRAVGAQLLGARLVGCSARGWPVGRLAVTAQSVAV